MPEIKGIPFEKRPELELVGLDGNAYSVMGAVKRALEKAGLREEAKQYIEEAMSGDYDHLLMVSMSYVKSPEPKNEWDEPCEECGEIPDIGSGECAC